MTKKTLSGFSIMAEPINGQKISVWLKLEMELSIL